MSDEFCVCSHRRDHHFAPSNGECRWCVCRRFTESEVASDNALLDDRRREPYERGYADGRARGYHQSLLDAADAIQALHPGEVKASVEFLRARAESLGEP